MSQCSRCGARAVHLVRYSGKRLCARHLCGFVEERVAREVRSGGKLPKGTKIACAVSGGKDSAVMLRMLRALFHPRGGVSIEAIIVDEGIRGYRSEGIRVARRECKALGIPLHVASFESIFGQTLDSAVKKGRGAMPCSICGVWRRAALNRTAKEIGAQRLALGHNLNDTASSILMNVCRADVGRLARMAPHESAQPGLVPRMVPLRWLPEEEIKLYSILKGMRVLEKTCPYADFAERGRFVRFLEEMEDARPGTRHSIARFWDEIREQVRAAHPSVKLGKCGECGEPTLGRACKACSFAEELE